MGKAQDAPSSGRKGLEASSHDDGSPAPKLLLREKLGFRTGCVRILDRCIAFLGRLRLGVSTEGNGGENPVPRPLVVITKPPGRLKRFLLAVTMLLAGLIAGADFSYALFEQRLSSQANKILDQADGLFQQQKELDHADRAKREMRDELKETRRQMVILKSESDRVNLKFIEAEGRLNLYGSSGPVSGGNDRDPASRRLPRQARQGEQTGNCNLFGNATSAELDKCLQQFNR